VGPISDIETLTAHWHSKSQSSAADYAELEGQIAPMA
jgi:hypothetical protein